MSNSATMFVHIFWARADEANHLLSCIDDWRRRPGATISVKPAANGGPALVSIYGDLKTNDGNQFRSKTNFLSKAIISFRSDGGSVVAGIQIGESIRLKGFTAVVAGNARCASACAIAWFGGTPRLMSAEARIGFHAAYNNKTGQETGIGNALVGAYLNKIGLSYSAVIYITQAAEQRILIQETAVPDSIIAHFGRSTAHRPTFATQSAEQRTSQRSGKTDRQQLGDCVAKL